MAFASFFWSSTIIKNSISSVTNNFSCRKGEGRHRHNSSHLYPSNGDLNANLNSFGSDSGTSSGVVSSLTNRPDNTTQMYYQNYEDAVREIQNLDNTKHDGGKPLKPDLLQNTFNRNEGFIHYQPSSNEQQNIYANDDFMPSELNDPKK